MRSSVCSVVMAETVTAAEPLTVAEPATAAEPLTMAEPLTVAEPHTVLDALEHMLTRARSHSSMLSRAQRDEYDGSINN